MARYKFTPKISGTQIKIIHIAKGQIGMTDEDYRGLLADMFKVESSKQLSADQAAQLIDELKTKGFELKTKGRPARLKKPTRVSRDKQLQKVEALLTVGGKSWAYADGMAKRICKVDSISFVPDDQLYKIITALRKQAQREGWDLSGEN